MLETAASRHQIIDLWQHLLAACRKRSPKTLYLHHVVEFLPARHQASECKSKTVATADQSAYIGLLTCCKQLLPHIKSLISGSTCLQRVAKDHQKLRICTMLLNSCQQVIRRLNVNQKPLQLQTNQTRNQVATNIKSLISVTTCLQQVAKDHRKNVFAPVVDFLSASHQVCI